MRWSAHQHRRTRVDRVDGIESKEVQVLHARTAVGRLKSHAKGIWLIQHIVEDSVRDNRVTVDSARNAQPALQQWRPTRRYSTL